MDQVNIITNLQSYVNDTQELQTSLKDINTHLDETFQTCLKECMNDDLAKKVDCQLEIESILDYLHEELNTGHWSEIPIQVRRAFTAANYVKVVLIIKTSEIIDQKLLSNCLKTLDMGLLLGAPLVCNSKLLSNCASFLTKQINIFHEENKSNLKIKTNKRKFDYDCLVSFTKLKGIEVDNSSCPSVETFNYKYFTKQIPVKLQNCISHWPAVTKWSNVNYLIEIAGDRTVPIEIGSHYADENWCQKLMPLKDFIKNYFLGHPDKMGYLAQHNLFNQIPELRNDIYVPDYCCLGETDDEPDVNAWFGPAKTVSPLHYDPKNNILAQVFGMKQLIMFSPSDSPYLYPHETTLLSNTAQVDPLIPDVEKYPNFNKAVAYKCLLEPGDMLYIPPKWWHHVTALDKSFSVSFWWS